MPSINLSFLDVYEEELAENVIYPSKSFVTLGPQTWEGTDNGKMMGHEKHASLIMTVICFIDGADIFCKFR
jgi:hypothetical protein